MRAHETAVPESARRSGDLASAVFHILGAALSVAALVIIIVRAAASRSALTIAADSLYGASLLYYFVISSLTHMLKSTRARRVFAGLDEAGSYFLVAGSWTPLCFGPFGGALGWSLFGLLWGFGFLFFLASSLLGGPIRDRLLATYYLAVTLVLPLLGPIRARLGELLFAWLVLAGIIFAAGLIFRARDEMPYNHSIWHAFVLAASACQFFGLLGA